MRQVMCQAIYLFYIRYCHNYKPTTDELPGIIFIYRWRSLKWATKSFVR